MSSSGDASAGRRSTAASCLYNTPTRELEVHLRDGHFFWLDLEDPSDEDIAALATRLNLHPLTVEDAQKFSERPKFEEYPGYVFMVVYGVGAGSSPSQLSLHEVHLVISGDYVVTIRRGPLEPLAEIRQRYHDQPIRSEQFLVYKTLDAITGTFVPVLARVDDDIDEIEQRVIDQPTEESLQRIFALKRDLIGMRRVVTPMRDVFARNAERIADLPGMEADDRLYFRDLYDSLIRVSDLVDSYRDLLSGATDMYLSTVANRQNDVAKQLTIIATIFLPLSFITGFFGQNFSFLTGHIINHTWTFYVFGLGLLALSISVMIWFFRRKGWLGGASP